MTSRRDSVSPAPAALALALLAAGVLAGAAVSTGCRERPVRVPVMGEVSLIERFDQARLTTMNPNRRAADQVRTDRFTLWGTSHRAIFQVPQTAARFRLQVPPGAKLRFGITMPTYTWTRSTDGVGFTIRVSAPAGEPPGASAGEAEQARGAGDGGKSRARERRIFSARLNPLHVKAHRRIHHHEVDLSDMAGRTCELVFLVDRGPAGNPTHDMGVWVDPKIIYPAGEEALPRRGRDRPGFLLVTLDAFRADALRPVSGSCPAGDPDDGPLSAAMAPAITRLVREGFLASRMVTPSTLDRPAHATIVTGRSPAAHGLRGENEILDGAVATAAEILAGRGYATAAFVSRAGLRPDHSGLSRGFEHLRVPRTGAMDAQETVLLAVEWLRRHCREPFFCWVHLTDLQPPLRRLDPHQRRLFTGDAGHDRRGSVVWSEPFFRDRRYLRQRWWGWLGEVTDTAYIRASYTDAVDHLDRQLGRLLDELERSGVSRRTLVAVCGSRGLALGERGAWCVMEGLGPEIVHVPLVMRLPGRIPAGSRLPDAFIASTADVVPSALPLLLGERPPEAAGMDGRDLISVLYGRRGAAHRASWNRAVLRLEGRTERSNRPNLFAVLDGRYKLEATRAWLSAPSDLASPQLRLYDMRLDPAERENLKERIAHRDRLRRMIRELRSGDPLRFSSR